MVSGNQPSGSESLGRGKRTKQSNNDHRDFVNMSSDSSDNETNVGKNTRKRVSKSALVRGGRGKKANVGNRSRVTRSKNNTRDISNPGNSNTNQQSREMSDESDNDAPEDINLAEISDTISELNERVERYAVFSNTFLMAILKALPASTVDSLQSDLHTDNSPRR